MGGIKESDHLDEVRNRLYQRGTTGVGNIHHDLSREEKEVPHEWEGATVDESVPERDSVPVQDVVPETYEPALSEGLAAGITKQRTKKRSYRVRFALLGVIFFAIAMIVSSFFLIFGKNSISGENISITLTAPFTIGGGEELPVQVGIRNDNAVPMLEAVLIMEYPPGTKSVEETPRDLFTERIPLEDIEPGQTLNMPLRVVIFGNENEEKSIRASVEYRVRGSGARFYKESEPQSLKISSAPVALQVDNVQRISSGQESSVVLTVISNSLTPLGEVLVKAEYPVGFEFSGSDPEPSSGQNTWILRDVDPESRHEITITGEIVGDESDEFAMHFEVGIPNERDKNSFVSSFGRATTEFMIEPGFLDLDMSLAGQSSDIVAVDVDQSAGASIRINNTLSYTVHDIRAEVSFSGNAFDDSSVRNSSGFYDSSTNMLIWDSTNNLDFDRLEPNGNEGISFSLDPTQTVSEDPFINVKVDVFARRVPERSAAEELIGSVEKVIRVNSAPTLLGATEYDTPIFDNTGPIPPEVGTRTTYTLSFRAENGTNRITGSRMTATLPLYVDWLDTTAGDGVFEFNQTTRQVSWDVGELAANSSANGSFQVSFLPSTSQVRQSPELLTDLTFTALDVFTGSTVRATARDPRTTLPSEAGYGLRSGNVAPAGGEDD